MNKGFTLVELLAVIIILALLIVLTSTSVTKVVKNSKENLSTSQIKLIESAAKNWGAENMNKLPKDGKCKYLTLNELSKLGYINNDIIDPNTNKKIDKDLKIKITSNLDSGKNIIKYKVNSNDISDCSNATSPCTLISGVKNTIGSLYECEVSPGTAYNFHVLSKEKDGTTNLIAQRNICEDGTYETPDNSCVLGWVSRDYLEEYASPEDIENYNLNKYGPVTAMEYLNNLTSDWDNIKNLNISYDDENGMFTDFKITSKARLPYLSEVSNYDGTNSYLYNYFQVDCWNDEETEIISCSESNNIVGVHEEGMVHIDGSYGYWILASFGDEEPYHAMQLSHLGEINSAPVVEDTSHGCSSCY